MVKAGDVVAEIDRSTLATRMTEVTLATQKADAQMEQAQLDSALTLSTAREAIRTLELSLEEKRLAKEQAMYEAPTVRRQAEIDFERGTRALAQSRLDYTTRTEQAQWQKEYLQGYGPGGMKAPDAGTWAGTAEGGPNATTLTAPPAPGSAV